MKAVALQFRRMVMLDFGHSGVAIQTKGGVAVRMNAVVLQFRRMVMLDFGHSGVAFQTEAVVLQCA